MLIPKVQKMFACDTDKNCQQDCIFLSTVKSTQQPYKMHTIFQILAADYLQKKELFFIRDLTELPPAWSFELSSGGVTPLPSSNEPAHHDDSCCCLGLTFESSVSAKCDDIMLPRVSVISC